MNLDERCSHVLYASRRACPFCNPAARPVTIETPASEIECHFNPVGEQHPGDVQYCAPCSAIGYHVAKIAKGEFGELSKVREEIEEALDAQAQGVSLMVLMELSDALAAMDGYLKNYHPTIDLIDLIKMAKVTRRAYDNGARK